MTISLQNFSSQIQGLTYQLIRYQDMCDRVYLEQLGITSAQAYALLALPEESSLLCWQQNQNLSQLKSKR